jgi:1,4-dihydroxy-2-naphthoate octaprenyltransferase
MASFGLTPLAARQTALVALTVAVIASVLAVVGRAIRIGDRLVLRPLVGGTALVVAGTYTSLPAAIRYVGLFAILVAAMWSAWPRASIPGALQLRAR